jgi:hypothetical protein
MHPLDLVFFLLLIAWPLARVLDWHRSRLFAMGFVLLVVLGLPIYLALSLLRWPVVPALVMLIAWEVQAVSVMVGDEPPPPGTRRARYLPFAVALALVALVAALPGWLLPRTPLFVPSGSFLAGVVDVTWADSSRTDAGGAPYLFPVRLWFPAEPAPKPRRTMRHRAMQAFESDLAMRLPGQRGPWVVRGLTRAPIRLHADMRLATRQRDYPVVILSHGVPGSPALLATLATELASHGYVVASPEHLGASLGSVLPGDQYVPPLQDAFDDAAPESWPAQVRADVQATQRLLQSFHALDSAGRFTGRLRVQEVAWIAEGVSARAGPARDETPQSGMVVALLAGELLSLDAGIALPSLVMTGAVGGHSPADSATTAVEIPGALVADFSDLGWWSPPLLRRAGLGGNLHPRVVQDVVHRLTVSFLGAWTRHEPANLGGLVDSLPAARLAGLQPAG